MGIFNEFNKKEKPVFTGLKFGFGSGGGGGGATGPSPITASGGTKTGPSGGYFYHVFTTSTPIPARNLVVSSGNDDIDFLVVAGGGGGGCRGGGGGAGGLRSSVDQTGGGGSLESAVPVMPGSYAVTIGAGGALIVTGKQ